MFAVGHQDGRSDVDVGGRRREAAVADVVDVVWGKEEIAIQLPAGCAQAQPRDVRRCARVAPRSVILDGGHTDSCANVRIVIACNFIAADLMNGGLYECTGKAVCPRRCTVQQESAFRIKDAG